MTLVVYENITMNATYAGRESWRPAGQIQSQRVFLVIDGAPEGISPEDVLRNDAVQRLLMAEGKRENVEIRPESEWPEEVRRQVYSR